MISVFGASGYVGSNYCKILDKNKIHIISRESNDVPYDTTNIVYFISTVDNYNVLQNNQLDIDVNLKKLMFVLDSWKKSCPSAIFTFISSWFVYGKQTEFPVKETAHCVPNGFYSITKYTAEMLLKSYCETFNLKYRILRLANVMGRQDVKSSLKKNALTHLISNWKNNQKIKLYDNGTPIRDIIHIDDCVSAIELCRQKAKISEIYNISNSHAINLNEIAEYLIKTYNFDKNLIEYVDAPDFHKKIQTKDMWLDNDKLLSLGFKNKYNVYDVLDHIVKEIY